MLNLKRISLLSGLVCASVAASRAAEGDKPAERPAESKPAERPAESKPAAADAPKKAEGPAASDMKLDTIQQKAAYVVGSLYISGSLKQQPMQVNEGAVIQGLKDGLTGAKTRFSDQEVQDIMGQLRTKAQAAHEKPAAEAAPADAAKDKELFEKGSYAIGLSIAKNMKRQGADFDVEALCAGLKDGLAGAKPRYSEEEGQTVMSEFQKHMEGVTAKMAEATVAAGKEFLDKNGKREGVTTTASGLQYEVMKKGDGPKPSATDKVKVHYHGTLIDGTVFDSSVERGEPTEFPLNQVIKGWTEGVQLMNTGSKFKFFIPADLAYGNRAMGDKIKAGSALVFEVELLEILK